MDHILEEMNRVKDPSGIRESRFRDWVDYLCALVAAKDDEIAALKAKRGPGRPRKVRHEGEATHV